MQFREDINGLRAFAVVAVVLFHFNPQWMQGGFAGVDVFFVISGFLMTGIVTRGIEQKKFSLLDFYVARANRIIPALASMCLIVLLFGFIFLNPIDYKELSTHAATSASFTSNIQYWQSFGYFDSSSHGKWLLHTWSVSAEWQFYLFYPIVLLLLSKITSFENIRRTILLTTIFGFIFCAIISNKFVMASYYLLPTRAWEMLLGGVAYLYPLKLSNFNQRIVQYLGLSLIISTYFLISKESLWPGYLAIIPTLGTFLVIQANRKVSFVTNNIVAQKVGSWSYSIYLWHWPLVVLIYYYSLDDSFIYLGIALSVLMGYLSHRFIESIKFKREFTTPFSYLTCKPVYMSGFVLLLSFAIYSTDGAMTRLNNDEQAKVKSAVMALDDWDYPEPNQTIGINKIRFIEGSSLKNILFIGASHIEQTYPYTASLSTQYNIYYLTQSGCFLTPSFVQPKWSCNNIQEHQKIIKDIKFDKIVTSFYVFDGSLSDNPSKRENQINTRIKEFDNFLSFAKDNAKEVYLILGEPRAPEFDPKASVRFGLNSFITVEKARKAYTLHNEALNKLEQLNDVKVIDPITHLCDDVCEVMDNNFNFYYKDSSHMRPWYARQAMDYLSPIFEPVTASAVSAQ